MKAPAHELGPTTLKWTRFMPHPLAIKYGTGDPKIWGGEKRAKARDELHAVLGAGRDGKKRLTSEDRIELMRIWLAVIAADHTTDKEGPATAEKSKVSSKPRFRLAFPKIRSLSFIVNVMKTMTLADFAFIIFLGGITVSVFALGYQAVREVLRIEEVKKEAEEVGQWFKATADQRKNSDFKPEACQKSDGHFWKDCVAALTAEGGPLHNKSNPFQANRKLISKKCGQHDTDTIGTIIIDKGAIPAGSSSYSYTAFDGTEAMNKDLILRIMVCGRGFHLIKVQNELSW
jgi:hypothetical protein